MQRKVENRIVMFLDDDIGVGEPNFWPEGDYPLHYHDHYEMEIVISGNGSQLFNGEICNIKEKDMYLLRPLDYHKIYSKGIYIRGFSVKPSVLPKWIVKRLHAMKNPAIIHLKDEDYQKFLNLYDLLYREIHEKHEPFFDTKANLVEIIYSYFLRLDESSSLTQDNAATKVIYYLKKNNRFTEKVTLDEIAEAIGYSKFYTSSAFHKQYGTTIQDYIINQRIEYAKKLMLETNYSMTEIIMECGFSSTSNFYSKFIERVGCSPLKFKKQNKSNKNEGKINENMHK